MNDAKESPVQREWRATEQSLEVAIELLSNPSRADARADRAYRRNDARRGNRLPAGMQSGHGLRSDHDRNALMT